MLVRLADGSAFSAEFTELAPSDKVSAKLDDSNAFRGAWIEFRTKNLAGSLERLRQAGIREFKHRGSEHVYFSAPGGQVFRLLDVDYQGVGVIYSSGRRSSRHRGWLRRVAAQQAAQPGVTLDNPGWPHRV